MLLMGVCLSSLGLWASRVTFIFCFVTFTLPGWLLTCIADLPFMAPRSPESSRSFSRFIAVWMWQSWRAAIKACCWLKVDWSGAEALEEAGARGRPVFLIANHQSFLDTPLNCVLLPRALVPDIKVLMARRHLRMPVLGRIAKAIGHIPIPYTTRKAGDFALDHKEMASIHTRIDNHVSQGGHLIVFPEGDLNSNWEKLLLFKGGGFEICIRNDMEVWGLLTVGAGECWPASVALGGGPARFHSRAFRIADSAREAAAKLAGEADLQGQGRALAAEAQQVMQRHLDAILESRKAGGAPSEADTGRPSAQSSGGLRAR